MLHTLERSWQNALKEELSKPYFEKLEAFVDEERKRFPGSVFPQEDEVFRALNTCPLEKVKVVILGQDPYPTKGHAHGLAFSVDEHVKPLPRSLVNIFRELQEDTGIHPPATGDLTPWAKQGVLLLNTVLTVREGVPNSHARKGWEKFTDRVIGVVNERRNGVVYLLWGRNAHQKAAGVDAGHNLVIRTSHPSPLGVTKNGKDFEAFRGSRIFSRTNQYLADHQETPIRW